MDISSSGSAIAASEKTACQPGPVLLASVLSEAVLACGVRAKLLRTGSGAVWRAFLALSRQAATTATVASRSRPPPTAATGAAMITADTCLPERPGAEFCPRLAKLGGMSGAASAIAACAGPKPGGRTGAREAEIAVGAEAGPTVAPAGAANAAGRAWAANGACSGKRCHCTVGP